MTSFTCCLMGWGALLVECGELLLERQHEVTGVVTRYEPARTWAEKRGIPAATTIGELREQARAPDYLFSITNDVVLDGDELAYPTQMAINLHSSLLPRYAGVHQTTWALLNGEQEHGVTWHEMVVRIDAGAILHQARFPITPTDTTLSLDIRCHEQALVSLADLVRDLEHGTVRGREQDPAERTYFPGTRLFPRGGLVSWRRADELDRWCRAGDFGQFDNRFGVPRVLSGGTHFVLRRMVRTGRSATAEPGELLAVQEDLARVATGTEDVEITAVSTPDGQGPAVGELLEVLGVRAGDRLPEPGPDLSERSVALIKTWSRHEPYWLDVLEAATACAVRPVRPLWLPRTASTAQSTVMLDRAVVGRLVTAFPRYTLAELLVTAWLICLGDSYGTVRWSDDDRRAAVAAMEALATRDVPVVIDLPETMPFSLAVRRVADRLSEVSGRGGYLRDAAARYPLHGVVGMAMPVALAVTSHGEHVAPAPDTAVVVGIDTRQYAFHLAATDHLGPAAAVVEDFVAISRSTVALLTAAAGQPSTPVGGLRTGPNPARARAGGW